MIRLVVKIYHEIGKTQEIPRIKGSKNVTRTKYMVIMLAYYEKDELIG